tara:strand:- start:931 stop:1401 length:471 start_codon:yes stop_codon:yes gene_type:complete
MDNANMPQQRMPETADEIAAAVFSECLITLVRSAAMLLGKVTVPSTGEPVKDLPRVQLVIKQLELLDKNASKLSLDEQQLVKQSLQELRMAYVSAAGKRPEDHEEPDTENQQENELSNQPEESNEEDRSPSNPSNTTNSQEENEDTNRKRFVKKYD